MVVAAKLRCNSLSMSLRSWFTENSPSLCTKLPRQPQMPVQRNANASAAPAASFKSACGKVFPTALRCSSRLGTVGGANGLRAGAGNARKVAAVSECCQAQPLRLLKKSPRPTQRPLRRAMQAPS
jgi:hypothetical protein